MKLEPPRARAAPGRGGLRAEEAEKRLGHALASDLFATSVANGAFGLLLLNPPYDYDSEDKRTEHAFLTQTTRYLAEGGLLVFIVPRQRLAVSARYLSTHYGRMRCWAFPHPEREVFDQVVLMGYRKADPVPDAHGESMVLEWAVGEPEPMRPEHYPPFTPKTTPSGDILFTTRTVDPVAAAAEARRSGLWTSTEITRHPLARQGHPHPPADAPAKGTHGDAGGGGLPRQPLPGGGGPAHPGQGRHQQGDGHGGGQPREGGPPGEAQDHGGRPGPQRRRDHRHRSIDGSPQEPRHKAPPSLYRETAGPRFVWTQHSYIKERKVEDADDHDAGSLLPVRAAHRPRRAGHADRIGGHHRRRAVSSPVKAYHLRGRCYEEYRAAEAARREALKAA